LVARTLITTADERAWPIDKKKPVIFLGEWCKRFSRKNIWSEFDSITAKYHWDDREKLKYDYSFLNNIYEDVLLDTSKKLNSIHGVEHSIRYWRILIGPWLGIFIQIIFDRYTMLNLASKEFEIDLCYINDNARIVPNDMSSFISMIVTDSWNEEVYAYLIKLYFPNIKITSSGTSRSKICSHASNHGVSKTKKIIYSLLEVVNKLTSKSDKLFIFNSGFSRILDMELQVKAKQFPKIWKAIPIIKFTFNNMMRCWDLDNRKKHEFYGVVEKMIPMYLPKAYIEGYTCISSKIPSWPNKPNVIFTSVSFYSDDFFKAWAADKVENGASLIIAQHGGNFGMSPMCFLEDHQIGICDIYLSWGWLDIHRPKIIPIGNMKNIGNVSNYNPSGGVLMVEYVLPRYSYQLYSVPLSSQWIDYLNDQCTFLNALPEFISTQLKIRIHKQDFGWDQKSRLEELFPNIEIDNSNKPIKNIIGMNRIYISTYNATTYLESLSWNFPTIIYWNPEHWEIKSDALYYFNLLESVGIFHRTPADAAQQLIKVWDDVLAWWNSELVQDARIIFCNYYSKTSNNSKRMLSDIFHDPAKKITSM
jgi:putative transferase (TIGR04331 family)